MGHTEFSFKSHDPKEAAYLYMTGHPGTVAGGVKRTLTLDKELTGRDDLTVNLDFDEADKLIGIEVVSFD